MFKINEKEIIDLYIIERLSISKIAKQLKTQNKIISAVLKNNNIEVKKCILFNGLSENNIHNLIIEYQSGTLNEEICKKYEIGKSTLFKIIKKYGVKNKQAEFTNDLINNIINDYKNQTQITNIIKKYNSSRGTILKILHENGIEINRNKPRTLEIKKMAPQIIELYQSGTRAFELQKKFGISDQTFTKILKENNIPQWYDLPKIDPNLEQEIIEKYNLGLTTRAIGREYNIRNSYIADLLKKNNIELYNHKYKVDENCLDILTQEAAYFLGFFIGDGCITGSKNQKSKHMSIVLHEQDEYILQRFSKLLCPEEKTLVKHYSKWDEKYSKTRNQALINLGNEKLIQQLKYWGCGERKSLTVEFTPILEKKLDEQNTFSHFLRGISDADGCLFITDLNKNIPIAISWTLVGSDCFIQSMHDKIKQVLNINSFIRKPKNCKISTLTISNRKDLLPFLHFLYKNCKICLDRKYKKYLNIISYIENPPNRGSKIPKLGEDAGNVKLNNEKVKEIRELFKSKLMTIKELSIKYNICIQSVANVIQYKTWKHI